jgi:inosine-uridine nucleoside N-ribohydrolase
MMARKIIIDTDPGIDDAVAMTLALFDPRLEVTAITATGGNVSPRQATLNVQTLVELLDPPRLPRLGAAPEDTLLPVDGRQMHGADGLGNANLPVAEHHNAHPAEKVLCDEVRAAPHQVTILALGPLTNLARAFQHDPQLPSQIGRLIVVGGTIGGPGNVSPAAEFNFYADPLAARTVLRAPMTKTVIPLDVTSQLVFSFDLLDELPPEDTPAGSLLRQILPYRFRAHRQMLGLEGIYLHDVVGLVAAIHPELFETSEMAGDVETEGELTSGALVVDRRQARQWRPNMEVATAMDAGAVRDCVLRGLARAGKAS